MKRTFDFFFALLLLILFSPFFLSISLLIILTSGRPIFFRQKRLGLNGNVFWIYKFRTMIPNAEDMSTGLFSFENDIRITRVGHFLRKFSLDELPQLFNVLLGSMSFVGPRPPVTYELGPWDDYTPVMRKRFKVKPGITGLAQISGRNSLNWDQKIFYDNTYVDRSSSFPILYDLIILLKTVLIVFQCRDTVEKSVECVSGSYSERAHMNSRSPSDSPCKDY